MSRSNGLPLGRLAAEFSVIVVGVLVALLAESAWEERGERVQEAEILDRIRAELVLDSALLGEDRVWLHQVVPMIEDARAILAGETRGSPQGDLALLVTASFRRIDLRDARTYDDLLASGRMSLIRDPATRRALITFYGEMDRAAEEREALPTDYRERIVAQVPLAYATAVLTGCVRQTDDPRAVIALDIRERVLACDAAPEEGAEQVLARLRRLPGLAEQLGTLSFASFNAAERADNAAESFQVLRAQLAATD